jgi:hypothetical protein
MKPLTVAGRIENQKTASHKNQQTPQKPADPTKTSRPHKNQQTPQKPADAVTV